MTFDFKNAKPDELKAEYNRIAKEMGDDQFFTKKELNHLPEILSVGEQVLAFSSGLMDGNTWLIALTDRRIVFLDKGLLYGLKQASISLDKVNAVSGQTGIFFGKIIISDGAGDRMIDNVWKKTVKGFTNSVQLAIDARRNHVHATPPQGAPVAPVEDSYDKLAKIAKLHKDGILSEAEFLSEKKKILSAA